MPSPGGHSILQSASPVGLELNGEVGLWDGMKSRESTSDGAELGTALIPWMGVLTGVPEGAPDVLAVGSEEGDSLTSVTGREL